MDKGVSMIQLSYSTFGLTDLDFIDCIGQVDSAGYPAVEIAFHRDHFNPFEVDDEYIAAVRKKFGEVTVRPGCIATASHFFTPSRPHEPSLICPELAGRKRRIQLIKRGIDIARKLGVSLVSFGSGFIRDEHLANPSVNPEELLIDSIHECLKAIHDDEDITLLIEPEPGMFIETMDQALPLVDKVGSPRFRLHLDLCHMYCSERDYVGALAKAAPSARYLHVSDAREGSNLKIVKSTEDTSFDLDFARYLVFFPENADYLLVDRENPIYFYDERPGATERAGIERILGAAGVNTDPSLVDYNGLFTGASPLDDEMFTYWISVPGLTYDVLERARPILHYLRTARGKGGKLILDKLLANTRTGICHFHEIPGEGTLDFAASFKALSENGYSGYASVELYHHVQSWERALKASYRHLSQFVQEKSR